MPPARLLRRILRGDVVNVDFREAGQLLKALGFVEVRVAGSHHIFVHPGIPEQLSLQDRRGQAKPYQLRQLGILVRKYDLRPKEGR